MKSIVKTVLVLFVLVAMVSCEENEVPEPVACFETSVSSAAVGATILFESCSEADFTVIWTGDEGHDYSRRPEVFTDYSLEELTPTDNGVVVEESYSYSFETPGTYTVVWVASNVGNYGEILKQTTAEVTITITE